MTIDSHQVALAHDAMSEEYDDLDDLWYPWLFAQIHEFIVKNLPVNGKERPKGLDVGCGTGFQSFLLSRAGYDVSGFDIAEKLLEAAKRKTLSHAIPPLEAPPLFTSHSWKPAASHHARIAHSLENLRAGLEVRPPSFFYGDLISFDFGKDHYDVIICCGSVLSFVDSYTDAFRKMVHGLRPGGLLFLEVEQKINGDLFWPIADNLLRGKLGYKESCSQAMKDLFSPPGKSFQVDYPFELKNGEEVMLPLWCFSVKELAELFEKNGLQIKDRLGVHWATNLIPSTILHKVNPGALLTSVVRFLSLIDGSMGRLWPMWRLGCSVVYCLARLRGEI